MAGELKVQTGIQADARTDGTSSFKHPRLGGVQQQVTQTTPGAFGPGTLIADNSADGVTLVLTGITANGWAFLKNLSPTATITWGPLVAGTLHEAGKLKPGEECVVRLVPAVTYAFKSSIATSPVQVVVFDD